MLRALKPAASKHGLACVFSDIFKSHREILFLAFGRMESSLCIWDEQLVALYVCCVCAGTRNDRNTSLGENYYVHRQQYD